MERKYWDEEIECMPLPQLVQLAETKLRELRVMERASRSALYRDRWATAGIRPEEIRTYADLKRVPYTTGGDLKEAFAEHHPDEIVCCENVRLWVSTSGTTGTPKWIPRADGDLATSREMGYRIAYLSGEGPREGEAAVGLSAPAPFVSDSAAYTGAVSSMLVGRHREAIVVNYTEAEEAIGFALRRKPQAFLAFPSIAMRLAEGIAEGAPLLARERLKERFNLTNLLAVLVTSLKKIRPRDLVKFKWGVFGGEPLDPYRGAIIEAYGLEPYEIYAFSEFLGPMMDCWAHDGLHIWMDFCTPEIIPQDELEREQVDSSYVPKALPLWEAPPGLRGEYVVTTFAEALPLIRYRVSDLIEVVSTEPCACGRTHPRIKVLHRADDIVNLGVIRFSIFELQAKLAEVAEIGKWQLRITREDYKPKAVLLVESAGKIEEGRLIAEIRDKMFELEVLRLGYDNKLIAEPAIQLVERLEEKRTSTGKLRLAIYEEAYSAAR